MYNIYGYFCLLKKYKVALMVIMSDFI